MRKTECTGNNDTSAMDRALFHWYWKMNWNWCFHSSAAGRVSSEEGNFDQLTNQTMPQIFEWKIGQQKGKSQKVESWKLPLFLRCLNVIVKWLGGGVLFKPRNPSPIPHSGAQSASRWIPWISTPRFYRFSKGRGPACPTACRYIPPIFWVPSLV